MCEMVLSSKEYIITDIKKPKKAKGFKEIDLGDTFKIVGTMKPLARASYSRYATMYTMIVLNKDIHIELSANEMCRRLENYVYSDYAKFREIDDVCARMPLKICMEYAEEYGDTDKGCVICLKEAAKRKEAENNV